jgi:hypothetical protein
MDSGLECSGKEAKKSKEIASTWLHLNMLGDNKQSKF